MNEMMQEIEIWNIIGNADQENINQLLKEYYNETKYPGALYWIGIGYANIENDMEQAVRYHKQAAKEGYRNSMTWLAEYYMNLSPDYLIDAEELIVQAIDLLDTEYVRFIQAKIYLLEAIYYEELGKYKKAMNIIDDLYNKNYSLAINFVKIIESQEQLSLLS